MDAGAALIVFFLCLVGGGGTLLVGGLLLGWRFCRDRALAREGQWPPTPDGEVVVSLTTDPGKWPWSDGGVLLFNRDAMYAAQRAPQTQTMNEGVGDVR